MKHDASISSLFPNPPVQPSAVAARLMETLPRAQLAKSYEAQLGHLAGPLLPRVQRVFSGAHAPIYLLTSPSRRQVWNAVLAVQYPIGDMDRLRTDLLERKSRDLLQRAYKVVPRGFTTVLNKSGEFGFEPDFYTFWHQYLIDHPEDLPALAARETVGPRLTKALRDLPTALSRLPVFSHVKNSDDLPRLVEAMTHIHHGRPDPTLWEELATRLIRGEKPLTILTKIVDAAVCPPPYITDDARFRHLASVPELKAMSAKFQNCLGSAFSLKDAVRGEDQYYEYKDGDDHLIVAITADTPFGFTIDDILGHKNARPTPEVKKKVEAALTEHGIARRRSVFDIVEDWEDRCPPDFEEFFTFEP